MHLSPFQPETVLFGFLVTITKLLFVFFQILPSSHGLYVSSSNSAMSDTSPPGEVPAANDNNNAPELQITFAYDLGTKNARVASQLNHVGAKPGDRPTVIHRLQDDGNGEEVPSHIGFEFVNERWKFTWGYQVDNARSRRVPDEHLIVIQWIKPCLLDKHNKTRRRATIEKQLQKAGFGNRDAEWLHSLQWLALRSAALVDARRRYPSVDFSKVREVNYVAVPEIADPDTNVKLMGVLKQAGFPGTSSIISETEASGAWALWKLKNRNNSFTMPEGGIHVCVARTRSRTMS